MSPMDRPLELAPIGKGTLVFAYALSAVLPAALVVFLLTRPPEAVPPVLVLMQAVFAVMLVLVTVLLPIWRRAARFDGKRLRVTAVMATRSAPLTEFDLDQARVVDIREHKALRPWLRTWGYQLPGLSAGHYRLRDKRKAFCLVTDPARVLLLPHVDGSVWLLSLERPQVVLDTLRCAKG